MSHALGTRSEDKFAPGFVDSVRNAPDSEGRQRLLNRINADKKRDESQAFEIYPRAFEVFLLWRSGHRQKSIGFSGILYEGMSAVEFTANAKLHGHKSKKRQVLWPWMSVACDEERAFYDSKRPAK